jgi:hypothetical protein
MRLLLEGRGVYVFPFPETAKSARWRADLCEGIVARMGKDCCAGRHRGDVHKRQGIGSREQGVENEYETKKNKRAEGPESYRYPRSQKTGNRE